MKLLNIKSILVTSVLVAGFSSCDKQDDFANVRDVKSVVSVDTKAVTVVEGNTITFTLTVNEPITRDIDLKLEYVSGTGSFRDYKSDGSETTLGESGFSQGSIGHILVLPALAKTATFTVTPTLDLLTEGTERIRLRLLPAGTALGVVSPESEFIDLTITDFVSPNVGVRLEWGQDTVNSHGTISTGEYIGLDNAKHSYDLYDMDLYVTDAGGNPISFDGGTGDPVENTSLPATAPNGDYFVFVDQYASPAGNLRPKTPFNKKMKVSLSKYSTWSSVIEVPFNSSAIFSANVVKITKVGNIYTVKDIVTNATIVSGRNSLPVGVKNFRKQLLDKRK